jgi:hypothetical protein
MTIVLDETLTVIIVAAALLTVLFAFVWGYRSARANRPEGRENLDGPAFVPLDPPRLSEETRAEIEAALRGGDTMEAARIMRARTGLTLNRARLHVSRMDKRLRRDS